MPTHEVLRLEQAEGQDPVDLIHDATVLAIGSARSVQLKLRSDGPGDLTVSSSGVLELHPKQGMVFSGNEMPEEDLLRIDEARFLVGVLGRELHLYCSNHTEIHAVITPDMTEAQVSSAYHQAFHFADNGD